MHIFIIPVFKKVICSERNPISSKFCVQPGLQERRGKGKIGITIKELYLVVVHQINAIFLRLIKEQQRQVSKVLLDGLYDPKSNLSILLGAHHLVMQSVWKELLKSWQLFPNASSGHALFLGERYAPKKATKWPPSGS